MKPFFERFKADIKGMLWLTIGLFLALSLGSYDVADPSWNKSIGDNLEVKNYCGYFGSYLSDIMYMIFGVGAWFFTLVCFGFSWRSFKFIDDEKKYKMVWAFLLMLTGISLVSLYFPESKIFESYFLGGVIGKVVSEGLKSLFNFAGVALLMWSFTLILIVFYTEKPIQYFLKFPVNFIQYFAKQIKLRWSYSPRLNFRLNVSEKFQNLFGVIRRSLGSVSLKKKEPIEPEEIVHQKSIGFTESEEEVVQDKTFFPQEMIEEDFAEENDPEVIYASEEDEISEPPAPIERRRVKMKTKIQRRVENWRLPELGMLDDPPASRYKVDEKEIKNMKEIPS